jgi:type II secretory pathway component PulC
MGGWIPDEPELPDVSVIKKMSNQRLMTALSFLTKVEPPPVVEKVVNTPPPEDVVEAPVEALELDIELALISYDETDGRHLAFLRKEREPAHPFLLDEEIGTSPPATLTKIERDHVVITSSDGKEMTLYLKGVKKLNASSVSPIRRGGAVARTVPTPAPVQQNLEVPKPQSKTSTPSRRYVPRHRNVTFVDEYGINVVEYNPTEEGHRRFAINEKDLKSIEGQALRLMSEVAPSPSIDANGNPNGIRLDFLTEEPLAKRYGLRSGDVLTEVNGKSVTNEMEAQNIYDQLGNNVRVVPVKLLRGENPVIIYLEMDDFPGVPPQKK